MTDTAIQPCPFCGDGDPAIDEIDSDVWAVCCNSCATIGPHDSSDVRHNDRDAGDRVMERTPAVRLDATKDAHDWRVHDVENHCDVEYCIWVDDERNQYGTLALPSAGLAPKGGGVPIITHQARRIIIFAEHRLIIINPADDQVYEERDGAVIANAAK